MKWFVNWLLQSCEFRNLNLIVGDNISSMYLFQHMVLSIVKANSAFLGRFFCTGQQQVNFKIKKISQTAF